jgi:hypothetical protein
MCTIQITDLKQQLLARATDVFGEAKLSDTLI